MQASPYSGPAWSSSRDRGSDSPETSSGQSNVAGLSSLGSDGSWKTRAIAIAVEAHMKLQIEPFAYVYNNLVEQKNCKVVVICCMSRIQDEMGVKHPIDLQKFGGVSNKKLISAIGNQMNNLNHFLQAFRKQLNEKGVELDIRISCGPKSHDILVEAAKALRPQWVVIDMSFSSRKKEIKAGLTCNLVLIKKGQEIEILQVHTPKYLDPEDQSDDRVSDELLELISTSSLGSDTPISRFGSSPGLGTSRPRSRRRRLYKRLKAFVGSMLFIGTNTRCSEGE